jgi:hypothetical protein
MILPLTANSGANRLSGRKLEGTKCMCGIAPSSSICAEKSRSSNSPFRHLHLIHGDRSRQCTSQCTWTHEGRRAPVRPKAKDLVITDPVLRIHVFWP